MTKKQFSLLLVVALVGGFIGGIVSCQLFKGSPALAQKEIPYHEILRVKKIQLIADDGKVVGELGRIAEEKVYVDKNGKRLDHPVIEGEYGLCLFDPYEDEQKRWVERVRVLLFVSRFSSELYMVDDTGNIRVDLSYYHFAQNPRFTLFGKDAKSSVEMCLSKKDNKPCLVMTGMEGETIWKAP